MANSSSVFAMFCDAGMTILAAGIALWLRPWRLLSHGGPPWAWVLIAAAMPLSWCVDRLVGLSGMPVLSLAPLLVLMAGWPLAVLALIPVGLIAALGADLGVGDALHRLAWMGVVPATLMLGLSAVSRRWLPKNIFSYIFGRAFIGTLVATALAGAAALWMQRPPSPAVLEALFVARLLTSFGEAFLCGMLIASLVAFRPMLLATYADRLYLSR
jgi:uncharacterized membrane protein